MLILAALACAAVNWLAVEKHWKPLEYLSKPSVMLLLLAWLWQVGGLRGWTLWFAAGIILSLAGDLFLMLPRGLFIAGLVSFFLAHLAYIAGLNPTLPPITPATLALAAILGIIVGQVYARISKGLAGAEAHALAIPVSAYSIVLTLMVLSAVLTLFRPEWYRPHALIVSCGAVVFLISDSLLAWDRFVAPLPHAPLQVMLTYHMGQIGILVGAGLHFLR